MVEREGCLCVCPSHTGLGVVVGTNWKQYICCQLREALFLIFFMFGCNMCRFYCSFFLLWEVREWGQGLLHELDGAALFVTDTSHDQSTPVQNTPIC